MGDTDARQEANASKMAPKMLKSFDFLTLENCRFMRTDGETVSRPGPSNEVEGRPPSTPGKAARKIILVIDDSPVLQRALVIKLRGYGYDVMTAEDGSAAVAAVGRMKPDLILLDINFPPDVANGGGLGWDGFLILQWLRRRREAFDTP